MAVTIRRYAAADAASVPALYARTAASDPTVGAIGGADWDRFLALEVNAGGAGFFVAEDDGTLVALATSSLRRPGHEVVRHFRIVVDPSHRRRGLAAGLLAAITDLDAGEAGGVLQGLCEEPWQAARAFLDAHRFAVVEEEIQMVCTKPAIARPAPIDGARLGRAADPAAVAEDVARLHNAGYADDVSFVPYSTDAMAALLAGGAEVWLLQQDGAIVGFCHLEAADRVVWIESLVIDPAAQGRQLGRLLGAHVVADIVGRQRKAARLQVSSRNPRALALYRRLGFARTGASLRYRAPREAVRQALTGG